MRAGTVVLVEEVPAGSELAFEYPRIANEVTNPGAETNTTGWATGGTGTAIARDTTVFDAGVASLRVDVPDPGSSSDRIEDTITLVEGETYHAWGRIRTVSGRTARLWVVDSASVLQGQANITGDGTFQDALIPSFVANANQPYRLRVARIAAGSPAYSIYGDRIILARGPFRGFVDGATPGYAWEGTAQNSRTLETGMLYVADPTDFQPEGGELLIGTEEKGYSLVDEDTGLITLDSPLVGVYAEGEPVYVLPLSTERFAHVQLEDQDEVLIARVPHSLYDRLPIGVRDENVDDAELAELGRDPSGELVVADVLNREPVVDASFLDPTTTPALPHTDGVPPASSPTPTVRGGVGSLFVSWVAIANADVAKYEVHVSTSSGFTPSAGTYAGETAGTLFVIEKLPGTTNRPAYGTTYFVKLIAKDADGAAAASAEGSGSPVQVNSPDLAVNSVIAGKIAANAVTAATLETVLALTSALLAGTPNAQRVEIGYGTDGAGAVDPTFIGIRAYAVDGTTQTFRVDAITGEVYVKGRVDWGTGSRLLDSDILEITQQTASTFMTPAIVQSAGGSASFGSSASISWPSPTQAGNLLLAMVVTRGSGSGGAPTVTTPAGWTQVLSVARLEATNNTELRLTIFKIENAASRSGSQTFNFSAATSQGVLQLFEYSGADVQDVAAGPADVEATNSGKSTTPSTGTPPTPTVANELWVACLVNDVNAAGGSGDTLSSPTNGYTQRRTTRDSSVLVRATTFDRAVTAIASPAMQATQTPNIAWLGAVLAIKAKTAPANVPADRADVVRWWARDVSGLARPHVTLEDGTALAVVGGKAGEKWELELVSTTVNVNAGAAIAAHTGGSDAITVSGVGANDKVALVDRTTGNNYLVMGADVTAANTVTVRWFNADSVSRTPGSTPIELLIIHRV